MLRIEHLSKTFNPGTVNEKKALAGLDLHLKEGDFLTVIGGNGAGKSTLLNAVAGTFPVDAGRILIGSRDVTNLPEYKRAAFIGRVFQDPMMGTAPTMQIDENLALAARRGERRSLKWVISREEIDDYHEKLKELGLALTLLMASLKRPQLLLLDEHTAALDPATAAKVLDLSDRIVAENGLTCMMITHNMRDAINHGNRLIMMNEGKIILDIAGEEKKKLTKRELLDRFAALAGTQEETDAVLLS